MNSSAKGFTLVEVLTVATILALLLAIMLPTFSRVMEIARETDCRNNLKRLSETIQQYCEKNNDRLPKNDREDDYPSEDPNELTERLGDRNNLRWWCNKVYAYGPSNRGIYVCPADSARADISVVKTCYGFNDTLTNPTSLSGVLKGDGVETLFGIKNSATTALLGHAADVPEIVDQPAMLEQMVLDKQYWPGVHLGQAGDPTGRCGFVMASGSMQTFYHADAMKLADPNTGEIRLFHK